MEPAQAPNGTGGYEMTSCLDVDTQETRPLAELKREKAMKRILLGTLFAAVSINAMAQAPGGPD
ncbi:hypothetical protein GIV53_12640, partial [Pseudomonas syringae]|nr:hypothetical protein [Pseudomonas syringae]